MNRFLGIFVSCTCTWALTISMPQAQTQGGQAPATATFSSLQGTVVGDSGPVAGAEVSITNAQTKKVHRTKTNEHGAYAFHEISKAITPSRSSSRDTRLK